MSLDLTRPENRAAVLGVLDAMRLRAGPAEWPRRLSALGERLNRDGEIDLSVYRSSTRERDQSAHVALGPGIGLERVSTQHTRELIAAWSAHGGPWQEREDCLAAPVA